MLVSIRKTFAALTFVACGAALSTAAGAACLVPPDSLGDWQVDSGAGPQPDLQPRMQSESWHGDTARSMQVDWRDRHQEDIIGYWNIVVTAKDGTVLDKGLQQWHDDGTEMLNSSYQHPLTQNYCLGVWEKTGPSSYTLNHFAYNYNANQDVIGLVRIRADVIVKDNGTKFVGKQTVDVYDTLRNHLAQLVGTVIGKRITIETTAQDVQ